MTLSRKIANSIVTKNIPISSVVELLTKYKMLSLLPLITRAVKERGTLYARRDSVMIESPFALSPSAVDAIKKIVGAPSSHHDVTINKNLLAGFKARYQEVLYDGSAERIIKNFTK